MFARDSIYTRLLAVFILIIAPLQIMQFAMHRWSRGAIEQELSAAASANVEYLRDDFVDAIKRIIMQQELLMLNTGVTRLFAYHDSMNASDYYMEIRGILNLLQLVQHNNPYIKRFDLYYLTHNRAISTNPDNSGYTFVLSQEELAALIESSLSQHSIINRLETYDIISGDTLEAFYIDYKRSVDAERPHFLLRAVLNGDEISRQLASFSAYNEQKAFLLNHGGGMVLASSTAAASMGEWLALKITPAQDGDVRSFEFTWDGVRYIAVYCYAPYVQSTFVQLIDYDAISAIPSRLGSYILLFQLVAFVLMAAYTVMLYRLVSPPIADTLRAFEAAGAGDMQVRLNKKYSSEFNQLAQHFNVMVARIQALIQKDYESTIRVQQAELKQLQAQINPHFLYNSFYLLRHAISQEENERAALLCDHLGDYFAHIGMRESYLVTLAEEYGHALSYAAIQAMRFGEYLRMEAMPLPDALSAVQVPRLILQPLLENAMEYGVPTHSDIAVLRLFATADGEQIRITVEDNGGKLTDERLDALRERLAASSKQSTEASALVNIHRRLQIFYGASSGLTIARSGLGGLRVVMTLGPEPQKGGQ